MSSLFDVLQEDDWYKEEPPEPGLIPATPEVIDQALSEVLAKKTAELEAKAKPGPVVTKRKRQGLQLCNVFNPERPPKWAEAVLEPKVDGYRCIAIVRNGEAQLLTSTQLPYGPNVRFIKAQLEAGAAANPLMLNDMVLDGEITHRTLAFDEMGGSLRAQDERPEAEGMVFTVWDMLDLTEWDAKTSTPLLDRKQGLARMAEKYAEMPDNRILPIAYQVAAVSEMQPVFEAYLAQGYEGIVLKDAQGLYVYEGKAGTNWLKHKPYKEGDLQITGAVEGRGKHVGRLGAIQIKGYLLPDGNIQPDPPDEGEAIEITGEAGTGQALNDKGREQMWAWHQAGTLVGRVVEIRYQDISPERSLRFPRFYRLRADKDNT